MRKSICTGCLAVLIAASSLTGCQIGNTEYVFSHKVENKKSVFTINGYSTDIEEAKVYLCNYKNLYGNVYGMDMWDYDFGESSLQQYVKDVTISELTRIVCMDLIAQKQEIVLDKEEEEKVQKAAEEYYESLSKEEIDFMDVNKKNIEEYYSHYALAEKLYQTLTNHVETEISDDEARVICVKQIYVANKEKADEVAQKLANGESFDTVAASYNEASQIEITFARGDLPKEAEQVAFNLDNGQHSEMVLAGDGYYFFECVNKFEEELTQENKITIQKEREIAQFDDNYEKFENEATAVLNKDVWEAIEIEDATVISTNSFFSIYDKYFN